MSTSSSSSSPPSSEYDRFLTLVDPSEQAQLLYPRLSLGVRQLSRKYAANRMQIEAQQTDQCLQILKTYLPDLDLSKFKLEVEVTGKESFSPDRVYTCRKDCTECSCFNGNISVEIKLFREGEAVADYTLVARKNPVHFTKKTIRFAEPTIVDEELAVLPPLVLEKLQIDPPALEEALAHMYHELVNS